MRSNPLSDQASLGFVWITTLEGSQGGVRTRCTDSFWALQRGTWTGDRRRSELPWSGVGSSLEREILTEWVGSRYLSKIVFTYILGYQVDIGHMEAVNLISSPKYSEKQIVRSSSPLSCLFPLANPPPPPQGLPRAHSPHARELGPSPSRRQFHSQGSGRNERDEQLLGAPCDRQHWRSGNGGGVGGGCASLVDQSVSCTTFDFPRDLRRWATDLG